MNFFQPIRKLIGKERIGAKVRKRFDEAQTPYRRLLVAGVLDVGKGQELGELYMRLNPVRLRKQIEGALEQLWALADRPETAQSSKRAKDDLACG